MMGLEEFLEEARQAGTLDSRGEFTLDASRAQELLRTFQLADRTYFLTMLVQAAVAGFATEVRIRYAEGAVELSMFGGHLARFETSSVLRALTEAEVPGGDPALARLTTGLNAAIALKPERVEWTVWNAWRRESLVLTSQGSHFEKVHRPPWPSGPGYQFRISPVTLKRAELFEFAEKLRFCPVWVHLDTRFPKPEAEPASWFSLQRWRKPPPPLVVSTEPNVSSWSSDVDFQVMLLDGGPNAVACVNARAGTNSCLQSVGSHWVRTRRPHSWRRGALWGVRGGRGPGRLGFLHYGVLLGWSPFDEGTTVVCSTDGLTLDLSQLQLVKDDVYRKRLADIRWLFSHVAESPEELDWEGRFEGLGTPLRKRFTVSTLPELPEHVLVQSGDQDLVLKNRRVPGLQLKLIEGGYGRLYPSDCGWPTHPPAEILEWENWVRGAVDCLARDGFVKVDSSWLPGPYNEGPDGVFAAFYPDGQLKLLRCLRSGTPFGWELSLQHGVYEGEVRHWEDPFEERFQPHQVWADWVKGWIETVYRDAL